MRWAWWLGLAGALHLRRHLRQASAVAAAVRASQAPGGAGGIPAAGTAVTPPEPGEVLGKLQDVPVEPPVTNYRCLPFPGGCDHLMHMCAIMSQPDFGANSTCLSYGLDTTMAFTHCREESFRHGADKVLEVAEELPQCLVTHLPKTPCKDVCLDLMRAAVPLGDACERSCTLMGSCMSMCTSKTKDPVPLSSCVGNCMGTVQQLKDSYSAAFTMPECNTTNCEWLRMATESWEHANYHLDVAMERADHMIAATHTLYDLSKVGTDAPTTPTPFPWPVLEKRIQSYGTDPFAAFSPATPLPPSYQLVDPAEVGVSLAARAQRREHL